MAAGRHGGYRDNEFRNREGEFGLSRKEVGYSDGGYEGNGGREYEKGKVRSRGILENRSRVRQNDIREREVMNGEYHSTSSRSNSGSGGGGHRRCGYAVHTMDREPGELSSDGSDEAIDSENQANKETEIKKLVNGNKLSPLQTNKRKFSPIVWDRDDTEFKTRNISETINLPPPPPLSKPEHLSPAIDHMFDVNLQTETEDEKESNVPEASPMELLPDLSDFSPETTHRRPEEFLNNQGVDAVDGDDDVPTTRTINSSRWANDIDSPVDKGEISDHEDVQQLSRNSLSESTERRFRKSTSPEFGEVKREGSEGTRRRSFGSEERVRSSSRDSNHDNDEKNDSMEVDDDHNYDATSVSQSDMESEDDHDSRGTPDPAHTRQRSFNMLQGCRNVDEFERLNKIDEGTYGVVFRARDKKTGEVVALKKVKMEKEREGLNILLSFHHPFIVDVKEVVVGSNLDSIFMVMEYMEHDLKGLMETLKQPFSQSEVKCLMLQLFGGVKYLHDNWVLHRDLKTSNLLFNNRGKFQRQQNQESASTSFPFHLFPAQPRDLSGA